MRFQSILALVAFTLTSLVFAAPVAVAEPVPAPVAEPEAKAAPGYDGYGA
jgi:hypothetical protein